jgi:riboflavin biosynthesis pyrimidine reductase
VRDAEAVSQRLRRLYGSDPAGEAGVLHSIALWIGDSGEPHALRIAPGCPQSDTDAFLLRAARMRADAIVTTGQILRDEPQLTHEESSAGLRAWRRERVGLQVGPRTVILTSGDQVDMKHPALGTEHRPMIITGKPAVSPLQSAAHRAGVAVEVIGREATSIRDTLALLRGRGHRTILVEAGPTTAASLYEEPLRVDELLLAVYRRAVLAPQWIGPRFLNLTALEGAFRRRTPATEVGEPDGECTFQRLLR